MKKIKHILYLLLSFSITGFSQSNTFIIKVIDSEFQVDSVILGYRENASVGVDQDLDEFDLYETPYSDIDVRSIQRNSITQNSVWLYGSYDGQTVNPFQSNIDLKKDFRPYVGSINEHFIIKINAINFPLRIIVSYLNMEIDIPYCEYIDNVAYSVAGELQREYNREEFTLFTIDSSQNNNLIGFHPQIIVKINNQSFENSISIFPNPVKNTMTIKSDNSVNQCLVIYNFEGKKIDRLKMLTNQININVSNYPSGLYYIGNGAQFCKFIKK